MEKKFKLGIIGCGFMATAIIKGILNAKKISPLDIIVSEKTGNFNSIADSGLQTTTDNAYLASNSEYVFLAVKPQSLDDVILEIGEINVCKFISILAGVTKERIKKSFPNAKVARCMPNTPCSIGCGVVAVDNFDFNDDEKLFINGIFGSLGEVVNLKEDKMNAVTGISGSGPAYVYLFIKSLVQAGVNEGLTEKDALNLAVNTVIGSGFMVKKNDDKTIDELINAVCSKGGTTIEAVKYFNDNCFSEIIGGAVRSCVNRAKELGGETAIDEVVIYTDGACSGNPGAGGWGVILMHGGKRKELSGGEKMTTNNRMELTAVISALKALKKPCKVKLYTDSTYVADAFLKEWIYSWQCNGWKTSSNSEVKNIDLWEELLVLVKKHTVEFNKVKGHADNEFNNRCDELARAECKKIQ